MVFFESQFLWADTVNTNLHIKIFSPSKNYLLDIKPHNSTSFFGVFDYGSLQGRLFHFDQTYAPASLIWSEQLNTYSIIEGYVSNSGQYVVLFSDEVDRAFIIIYDIPNKTSSTISEQKIMEFAHSKPFYKTISHAQWKRQVKQISESKLGIEIIINGKKPQDPDCVLRWIELDLKTNELNLEKETIGSFLKIP